MVKINIYDNVRINREKTGYAVELYQALRRGSNTLPSPCPLFSGDCCEIFADNESITVIGETFRETFKFSNYEETDKDCGAKTLKLDKLAYDIIRITEKHLIYD